MYFATVQNEKLLKMKIVLINIFKEMIMEIFFRELGIIKKNQRSDF